MKVLNIVGNLEKGGTQKAAQVFTEAYAKLGHESKLLYTERDGIRGEELRQNGYKVWGPIEKKQLDEVRRWSPHVVHLHSHGINAKDVKKIYAILENNSLFIETNVFSKPSPWTHLLDVSLQLSFWCDFLFNVRGRGKFQTNIVPYPVNVSNFFRATVEEVNNFKESLGIEQDVPVIGRVGQFFPGKWSSILFDSFEYIRKRERCYLVLVNPPENIISIANQSSYSKDIKIVDQVIGDKNLRAAYSAFDVFAHAADQGESFGMVLAESLLCETPVVTLSTPWGDNSQCEVVKHNVGGYVCTSRYGFTQAIYELIKDKGRAKLFGAQGRERVIKKYDYTKVASDALISTNNLNKTDKKSTKSKVIKIYKDSYDRYSIWTIMLLRISLRRLLVLTRVTSGYENFSSLLKKKILRIMNA